RNNHPLSGRLSSERRRHRHRACSLSDGKSERIAAFRPLPTWTGGLVLSESAIYGWAGGARGWGELSLRLLATIAAAIVIGWDRRSAGQVAGLRTVILVAVAAALS